MRTCVRCKATFTGEVFCGQCGSPLPSGVFLPKRETTAAKIQARYTSSARTNLVYGGSSDGKIADRTCFNGFCNSLPKGGGPHPGLPHPLPHLERSCRSRRLRPAAG